MVRLSFFECVGVFSGGRAGDFSGADGLVHAMCFRTDCSGRVSLSLSVFRGGKHASLVVVIV